MQQDIFADRLFTGRDILRNVVLRLNDGKIVAIDAGDQPQSGPRRFILPALVNAHDHARPTASSFGTLNMPLESWINRSVLGTPPDPYLAAARAMARSAKAGCCAMMIHYTKPSGQMDMVSEAREIGRAAQDVGIRLAFALSVRDQNPVVYGDASEIFARMPSESSATMEALFAQAVVRPEDYLDLIDNVAGEIAGPMIDVQYGPAGVQWCSKPLLEAIARRSAETGRRIHMHLLETIYQRRWADQEFPSGVVRYLADIGFLSDRLTLAHCIHATPEELNLIASSGASIVTNFSSNMHLRSGLAPIASAYRCGCSIAVGVDGLALDEDDDALREMRLVQMAHAGIGYDATWMPGEFFSHTIRNGRAATGSPGHGELAAGMPADFIVIDLDRLDRDRFVDVDPLELLFARGNASMIQDVLVSGRAIVRNARVVSVDLGRIEDELRLKYRSAQAAYGNFSNAWPSLHKLSQDWYKQL